jgi:hypothetical protein
MMLKEDIDKEIENLKAKRAEINSKMAPTRNFDTKEKLKDVLSNIDAQIKILDSMRRKSA